MTNSILYAFILSFSACISTVIGALIILFNKNKNNKIIVISLSFAAGVMICVSLIDLLPNCYIGILNTISIFPKIILTLIFMVIGIIISMLIDKYLPDNSLNKANNNSLYKVGIISMIAIIMHNIPEGIATFITSSNNIKLGITLTISIALHNIPEGISISIPIYYSTKSKFKAITYTFISALSEPIGAILTYLFLIPFINDIILGLLFSFIAGIMIQISLTELLPESLSYNSPKYTQFFFLIGIIFMLLKVFI